MKIERARRTVGRESGRAETPVLGSTQYSEPQDLHAREISNAAISISNALAQAELQRDLMQQEIATGRYRQLQEAYIRDIQSLNTPGDIDARRKDFDNAVEEYVRKPLGNSGKSVLDGWDNKTGKILSDETEAQQEYVRLGLTIKQKHTFVKEHIDNLTNSRLQAFQAEIMTGGLKSKGDYEDFFNKANGSDEEEFKSELDGMKVNYNGNEIKVLSEEEVEHYWKLYQNMRDKAYVIAGIYGVPPGTNTVLGTTASTGANPDVIHELLSLSGRDEKDKIGGYAKVAYFPGLVGEERLKYIQASELRSFASRGAGSNSLKWYDLLAIGWNEFKDDSRLTLLNNAWRAGQAQNAKQAKHYMEKAFDLPPGALDYLDDEAILIGQKAWEGRMKRLGEQDEGFQLGTLRRFTTLVDDMNSKLALRRQDVEKGDVPYKLPFKPHSFEIDKNMFATDFLPNYGSGSINSKEGFPGAIAGGGFPVWQLYAYLREVGSISGQIWSAGYEEQANQIAASMEYGIGVQLFYLENGEEIHYVKETKEQEKIPNADREGFSILQKVCKGMPGSVRADVLPHLAAATKLLSDEAILDPKTLLTKDKDYFNNIYTAVTGKKQYLTGKDDKMKITDTEMLYNAIINTMRSETSPLYEMATRENPYKAGAKAALWQVSFPFRLLDR